VAPRFVAGAAFALFVACRTGAPAREAAEVPRASALDPPPRRPDGIVVEPSPALPTAGERANAEGIVALREPLRGDPVRDVVLAMVSAWQRESLDGLVALLTSDAGPIEARLRGRSALVESWRQRLHAHEYARLAGSELVRPERIERYDVDELRAADPNARGYELGPEEVFVRIPLEVTRVAGERLFGDVVIVILRREEGTYKIAAYGEIDAP
jgi:hypothetical protein